MTSKLDTDTQTYRALFPTPQLYSEFQNEIKRILKLHRIIQAAPGLSCAISVNPQSPNTTSPQLIYQGSVGYADLDTMTKMSPSHTMMVASITKFITSVLVGRLIELGIMTYNDLHRPIFDFFTTNPTSPDSNYWLYSLKFFQELRQTDASCQVYGSTTATAPFPIHPKLSQLITTVLSTQQSPSHSQKDSWTQILPDSFHHITIAQLLSHTAGIRDYNREVNEDCSDIHFPNVFAAIQQFIWDPLLPNPSNAPKRKHLYTTFGYCLTEAVIECIYFNYIQNYLKNDQSDQSDQNDQSTFKYHPQVPISQPLSFQAILHRFISIPLQLFDLELEMVRKGVSRNRCIEYTRVLFPRSMPSQTPLPSSPTTTVGSPQQPLPTPLAIPTNTNKTLYPIVLNKSNAGGCIVSNVATLARFGSALTQSFQSNNNPNSFVSHAWLQYMHQFHYVHHYSEHTKQHQEAQTTASPYPTISPRLISPPLHPSTFQYGLGCINYHNTLDFLNSSNANHHTALIQSKLLTSPLVLSNPTIYHTGQGLGSSGILLVALADGISVAVLANVGQIDLKDLGADLASFVKQWILQRTTPALL